MKMCRLIEVSLMEPWFIILAGQMPAQEQRVYRQPDSADAWPDVVVLIADKKAHESVNVLYDKNEWKALLMHNVTAFLMEGVTSEQIVTPFNTG